MKIFEYILFFILAGLIGTVFYFGFLMSSAYMRAEANSSMIRD